MKKHIVTYTFVEDYLTKRTPFRKAHFEYLKTFVERGELILGGATANPADKGIIVYDKLSAVEVKEIILSDPYYIHGIVVSYTIQEWTVVLGSLMGQK